MPGQGFHRQGHRSGPPLPHQYELTPLGRTLAVPLAALADWAETHIESVLTAQQPYDTAGTGSP